MKNSGQKQVKFPVFDRPEIGYDVRCGGQHKNSNGNGR